MNPEIKISPAGNKCTVFADTNFEEAYTTTGTKLKTLFWTDAGTSFVFERPTNNEITTAITDNGNHVLVVSESKEIYVDGKLSGKMPRGIYNGIYVDFSKNNLLIGSSPSKICYYANGELFFADGSTKQAGVINPQVVYVDGTTHITWFRQCENAIYRAQIVF